MNPSPQKPIASLRRGLRVVFDIEGNQHPLNSVCWSPNGRLIAGGAYDGMVRIWNSQTRELVQQFDQGGRIQGLSWAPDARRLAVASADGITRAWDIESGTSRSVFEDPGGGAHSIAWSPKNGHLAIVTASGALVVIEASRGRDVWRSPHRLYTVLSAAWSADGRMLAAGCADRTVRIHDATAPEVLKILKGHRSAIDSVAASPNGRWLASGSRDHTVRIWDIETGRAKFVLDGHSSKIACLSFAANSRFLVSHGLDDSIRLWRCDSWEPVAVFNAKNLDPAPFSRVAFDPSSFPVPLLAEVAEEANVLRIWELDASKLSTGSLFADTVHYANAKAVLLGDSGVGKSGLSLVLTGKQFKPTDSTHGRFVHVFENFEVRHGDGHSGVREILLWDLAGQPGYRMIHQLHLDDVAVALVVFDSRSETDPFAGVRHWARALRLAEALQGPAAPKMKKFLVAARTDRGGPGVSSDRIEAVRRDLGFDGYILTSAKDDCNIAELKSLIRDSIQWDSLPIVSSTDLFQRVKALLLEEKRSERLLSVEDDLYRTFLRAEGSMDAPALKEQFHTCVGQMESHGLLRRFSFGGLALLQPELLDSYASMLVNAAKDEPDGLGSIATEDVLAGRFKMSRHERLQNKEQEKLLLLATAEELIDREIALREVANDGSYFVFPSQLTREPAALASPGGPAEIFEFQGAVMNIYATLAVRLSHSGFFSKAEMWKNAAAYNAQTGGRCGISLREIDEGHGEITLSFEPQVSGETRALFADYIHTHLLRRALGDTVVRRKVCVCPSCGFVVSDQLIQLRRDRGFEWATCPVCEGRIELEDRPKPYPCDRTAAGVPEMDRSADAEREKDVTEIILEGKDETRQFDVFLAHKTNDKGYVVKLANELRKRRLNPWLDKEQIPPGRWFQDVIQQAIPNVKSAAICIGPSGLGKWQALELRSFTSQCVERDLPVIPVLLPGVSEIPTDLPFLRELNWVKFNRTVADEESVRDLIWGITGKHPTEQDS